MKREKKDEIKFEISCNLFCNFFLIFFIFSPKGSRNVARNFQGVKMIRLMFKGLLNCCLTMFTESHENFLSNERIVCLTSHRLERFNLIGFNGQAHSKDEKLKKRKNRLIVKCLVKGTVQFDWISVKRFSSNHWIRWYYEPLSSSHDFKGLRFHFTFSFFE